MHSWYCATITTAWLLHFIPQIKPYIQRMQLPIPPLPDSDNHNPLCFCFFFFYSFIYLFYFTILYWFCHTLTWILHGCTCVPHPEPHSHLPPHPIPPGHPSAPALSTLSHALNMDWRFISHMIIYMFQCHSPYHPTLALSHRAQKTVQYICVSFAVSHTRWLLLSF